MATPNRNINLTDGLRDPLKPDTWLVRPWPVDASFNDVVQHFMQTYVGWLQDDRNTARRLAYWEAYQDALKVAPTDALIGPDVWHWHDDMVRCR